jgi:hypothetical protein
LRQGSRNHALITRSHHIAQGQAIGLPFFVSGAPAVAGHFKVIHPWTLESDSPVDRPES